jgi:hypothetical protein
LPPRGRERWDRGAVATAAKVVATAAATVAAVTAGTLVALVTLVVRRKM